MASSVLRRTPDGDGYVLVCDPENEATIYEQALTLNLWPRADEFGGPVKLIGADPDLKEGPPTGQANQALGIEAMITASRREPVISCKSSSRGSASVSAWSFSLKTGWPDARLTS